MGLSFWLPSITSYEIPPPPFFILIRFWKFVAAPPIGTSEKFMNNCPYTFYSSALKDVVVVVVVGI
jgi:hypothetical protein